MDHVIPVPIEEELSTSYLSYAMSVIVSRAIPDVRDGFKPVHRRIVYAMYDSGFLWGRPYRKSARVVGQVIGRYHPHGDVAVYDSLVRMAQDFSLRVPIVDGQGNFGSVDGDPPASMRYTEVKLLPVAEALVRDIKSDTVDFQPNYDGLDTEPIVLPAEFPNILVNGASGVAVGMATNIPTHNLGEIIDACFLCLDNPDVEFADLLSVVKGPDFPTGGVVVGRHGIISAFQTGRGSVIIRGKYHVESITAGKQLLVLDEIPYQVNKSKLVEAIALLVREKKIEGVSDLRDESNKHGMRIVIELRKGVEPALIFTQLCKFTSLQVAYGINMMVLNGKKPMLMSLADIIYCFLQFRREVVVRRTEFELHRARERAYVVIAMCIALINIDEVVRIIRASKDPEEALQSLKSKIWGIDQALADLISLVSDVQMNVLTCSFTEGQAKAILEMRLQRLTTMERHKLDVELEGLITTIKDLLEILASEDRLKAVIRAELTNVRDKFATPRLTEIEEGEPDESEEDCIPKEQVVVTVSVSGYVKRVKLSCYRTQNRGGRGKSNYDSTRHEDLIAKVFVASTHDSVLFFSNLGRVYRLKVYRLPIGEPSTRGRAFVNVFPLSDGEVINNVMPIPPDSSGASIVFSTAQGKVRRNLLSDFDYIPSSGKIAIRLDEGDALVSVKTCLESQNLLLSTKSGKSIRFTVASLRVFKGRTSDGVRGIRLVSGDKVISMTVLDGYPEDELDEYLKISVVDRSKRIDGPFEHLAAKEQFILTITENGYGKRTSAYEYRTKIRGGVGITNILTSKRNGGVVASFPVEEEDQIVMVTDKGQIIRIAASGIRITSRSTQGVTLFRMQQAESVVSVAKIKPTDEAEVDN